MEKRLYPYAASFLITEDCNLKCSYCFEKHNKAFMTFEVIEKGIDYLIENAKRNSGNFIDIMIFGGEPFMAVDNMEHIFQYGLARCTSENIKLRTSIVTNGTIMNDRIFNLLKLYRDATDLSIQLSVDGIKTAHDMYRLDVNGNGSFDRIEKNLPRFKELFVDDPRRLSVHGCLNKNTLPLLYKSYKFFREEWEMSRIWFMPVHTEDWSKEDVKLYDSETGKIYKYIKKIVEKTKNIEEVYNYAPLDHCMSPRAQKVKPCGAGDTFVSVTAAGEIYPCHHFYFNDPEKATKIGDVFNGVDEPLRDLYVFYKPEDLSCTKVDPTCDANHCYRCIGDNWVENGSILSQIHGNRCGLSKVERKYQKIMEDMVKQYQPVKSCNCGDNSCGCINHNESIKNGCDIVQSKNPTDNGLTLHGLAEVFVVEIERINKELEALKNR